MIDKELLDILACPDTKQDLEIADQGLVDKINQRIEEGSLLNRGKQKVTEKIDGGLIQKVDRKYLYPVVKGIPVLLVDEAIVVDDLNN